MRHEEPAHGPAKQHDHRRHYKQNQCENHMGFDFRALVARVLQCPGVYGIGRPRQPERKPECRHPAAYDLAACNHALPAFTGHMRACSFMSSKTGGGTARMFCDERHSTSRHAGCLWVPPREHGWPTAQRRRRERERTGAASHGCRHPQQASGAQGGRSARPADGCRSMSRRLDARHCRARACFACAMLVPAQPPMRVASGRRGGMRVQCLMRVARRPRARSVPKISVRASVASSRSPPPR